MKLRDHPLLSFLGLSSWPPAWLWTAGETKQKVHGEVGILREVVPSLVNAEDRMFLIIEHEGNEYMGCLMISDRAFCQQISELLRTKIGCTIEQIGSLDLRYLH